MQHGYPHRNSLQGEDARSGILYEWQRVKKYWLIVIFQMQMNFQEVYSNKSWQKKNVVTLPLATPQYCGSQNIPLAFNLFVTL